MSSRVGFHPDARRDLREAADFYDLERLAGRGRLPLDLPERGCPELTAGELEAEDLVDTFC